MVSLLLDQTTPSRPVLGLWPYDPRSEILTIVGLAVHRCSKRTQYGSGYLLRALIVQRDTCVTHIFEKDKRSAGAYHASVDDYVVIDPLLEKQKGKFSKEEQKRKKKELAWAGGART
eukprot:4764876-Pyramimonas_sp.AAC.1